MEKEIKNIYNSILDFGSKIVRLERVIVYLKKNLEEENDKLLELKLLLEEIEKIKAEYEKTKKEKESELNVIFQENYKIQCEIKDSSITYIDKCNKIKEEKKYKTILQKYWKLLFSKGFNEEKELEEIIQKYNEICTFVEFFGFVLTERKNNPSFLKGLNSNVLSKNLMMYSYLKNEYETFFAALNNEAEKTASIETINYILNNTNLIPLVYANNTYSIKGINSLRRTFLCQFHKERTPSMKVSINKNYYCCYACGEQGNQIDYLMKCENLTFDQALYLLAEIYLMNIPNNPFKEDEYSQLVNYYRSALISKEYTQFLMDSYNNVKEKIENANIIYGNLFAQIERIKQGQWDANFEYKEKSKKCQYDISRKRKLETTSNN